MQKNSSACRSRIQNEICLLHIHFHFDKFNVRLYFKNHFKLCVAKSTRSCSSSPFRARNFFARYISNNFALPMEKIRTAHCKKNSPSTKKISTKKTRRLAQNVGAALCSREFPCAYLFLFTIRDSNFPEAISMKRVKSEILFSAFSAFQIDSVNSSILSVAISTGTGSPSKLGRGLPSPK